MVSFTELMNLMQKAQQARQVNQSLNEPSKIIEPSTNQESRQELNGITGLTGLNEQAEEPKQSTGLNEQSLNEQEHKTVIEPNSLLDFSQQRALSTILHSRLSILTGAAGTGKTFTVKAILSEILKDYNISNIFITAFTGKAVLNLINTFKTDPYLNALAAQSMTIHKFLAFKPEYFDEPDPSNPNSFIRHRRFVPTYNSINKRTDCKVLIIDEVSMVDQKLMLQLVTALDTSTLDKLILVGDINQLQPVIGRTSLAYFAQHPKCNVSVLNEVHRQANGNDIVQVAHLIKQADLLKLKQVAKENKCRNVKFIQVENYIDLYRVIELINQKYQLKLAEHQDVIITPTNVGATGQEVLNQRLNKQLKIQKHLIQCGVSIKLIGVGDNIMFTKNDYERGFINGTVGRVLAVTLNEQSIIPQSQVTNDSLIKSSTEPNNLETTESKIEEPKENKVEESSSIPLDDLINSISEEYAAKSSDVVKDNEEKGFYDRQATHSLLIEYEDIYGDTRQTLFESIGDISSLILANAMTCYKAQGSTYSRCIVNLVDTGGAGINNEYAYTAVTRASDYVWIIFNERGLQKIKSRQLKGTSDEEKINFLISENKAENQMESMLSKAESKAESIDESIDETKLNPAEIIKSFCNNLTYSQN